MNKKKTASAVLEFYKSQLSCILNALYIMRQDTIDLLKTLKEEEGEEENNGH